MQKNIMIPITVGVVAIGVGFVGGVYYQKGKVTNTFANRTGNFNRSGNIQNRDTGTNTPRNTTNTMPGRGGLILGEVTNKDQDSLTIKMSDGSSKIVILSGSTVYRMSSEASADQVEVGSQVMVNGQTSSDGSVSATSIELNPVANRMGDQAPTVKAQ